MKKLTKICTFTLVMLILFSSVVFASATTNTQNDAKNQEITEIKIIIGRVLNVISWIGYAISLGMIMVIGMRYMMSAENERAELKKGLVNYVIGVIIIASAATIANIVSSVAMKTSAGSSDPAQRIIDVGKELGDF